MENTSDQLIPSGEPIYPESAVQAEDAIIDDGGEAVGLASGRPAQVLRLVLLVGSIILMFVGQYQLFRDPPGGVYSSSVLFIVVGVGAMLFVLRASLFSVQPDSVPVTEAGRFREPFRIRVGWLLLAFALFSLSAWRGVARPQVASTWEHLIEWGLAIVALVMSALPGAGQKYARDARPLKRDDWLILLALLAAALLFRVTDLGGTPALMDQDESKFADEGAALYYEGFMTTPFMPGVDSHPRIYLLMISASIGVFGNTLFAARFPGAIMAALTIPAIYLLGREIFSRRVGLIAAVFMVVWPFQIIFARLSMNQPADPLFATLAFYYLLRGMRRGANIDYIVSGIFLGLAQMFYLGGRLAPVAMVSYLVYLWLRDRPAVTRNIRQIGLVAVAGFLVTLPLHFYIFYNQEPLSTRADKSILVNGELAAQATQGTANFMDYFIGQLRGGFTPFIATGDRSGWYGEKSAMTGPFGGPLILLGTMLCLFALWKNPKWCIPLGWALLIVVGINVLGISPPQYERYYPGTPPFALLIAVGILGVAQGIATILRRPEWTDRLLYGFSAILFGIYAFYFVFDYIPAKHYIANIGNWRTNKVLAQMQLNDHTNTFNIVIGGFEQEVTRTNVINYFYQPGNPDKQFVYIERGLDPKPLDLPKEARGKLLGFIVAASRRADLTTLQNLYPGGNINEVRLEEDGSPVFYSYIAKPADVVVP